MGTITTGTRTEQMDDGSGTDRSLVKRIYLPAWYVEEARRHRMYT
jgi:hypothetical protein